MIFATFVLILIGIIFRARVFCGIAAVRRQARAGGMYRAVRGRDVRAGTARWDGSVALY